ncbi:hypothetical protein AK830_g10742 [Neonectria ditissima]|uniref:Uncharacterized protein n=1 Tax=Neonectria ditissima TaxID=78410 RepID=A0A0P7B316_9HYPO|nr:hypothetical protein AK830_g10742 [Neonectria ditissima]
MGAVPGHPSSTPGCWFIHGGIGSATNSKWQITNAIGGIVDQEYQDCDCHLNGLCMDGEPPLPPMEEFLMDDFLNPGWEARPWVTVPQKNPDHLYRPPGWRPGGPFTSGVFRGEGANPFTKRDLGLPRESPWTLPSSASSAFDALAQDKQDAILDRWAAFERYANTLSSNLTGMPMELDPRPSMAILLADPREQAGIFISAMDTKFANLVLRCADHAISDLLAKMMQEVIGGTPSNGTQRSKEGVDSRDIALKRSQYYEVFKHYGVLWKAHTPAGLTRQESTVRDSFPVRGTNGKLQVMKPDDICKEVTREAMANHGKPGSFVAGIDKTLLSLNQQIREDNDNSFLTSMHLPVTFKSTTAHLDWRPEALAEVFDTSLPTVQVGMTYFAVSLWAGNWPRSG